MTRLLLAISLAAAVALQVGRAHNSSSTWAEDRTALGKVAHQLKDCSGSTSRVKHLSTEDILEATQTQALLQELDQSTPTQNERVFQPKSACVYGLIAGTAGSLIVKHPLPLLLALSECLPVVRGQQPVGGEFQVNTYTTSDQLGRSVAALSTGNFVVSWQSWFQDGDRRGVYGQLFNATGSKVGSEFQVDTYTTWDQERPSVSALSSGNFVVSWQSLGQDGSGYGIYGQVFNATGSKVGSEFRVNTYTISDQERPSVAALSSGNFVVSWESNGQDGDGYGVYGQLFNGAGSKVGSAFQVNTYATSHQLRPSVAALSSGNFVVSWQSNWQDGSVWAIFGQLFDATGSKVGSEFQVNTYTTSNQGNPSVASLSSGNFVVSWMSLDQDGSGWGVYGQLFNATGSKVGSEFRVNTYTISDQAFQSVAALSAGNLVVSWDSNGQDGDGRGVYGQLFNATGSKIGSEFHVNTYTTSHQARPSVAALSSGNFVVSWDSYGQDGDGWGVYGQLFNDSLIVRSATTGTTATTGVILASSGTTGSTGTTAITGVILASSGTTGSTGTTATTGVILASSGTTGSTGTAGVILASSGTTGSTGTTATTGVLASTGTTGSQLSSTTQLLPTSSFSSSSGTSRSKTNLAVASSSTPKNNLTWLWAVLGAAAASAVCLGGVTYIIYRRRARQSKDDTSGSELAELHGKASSSTAKTTFTSLQDASQPPEQEYAKSPGTLGNEEEDYAKSLQNS